MSLYPDITNNSLRRAGQYWNKILSREAREEISSFRRVTSDDDLLNSLSVVTDLKPRSSRTVVFRFTELDIKPFGDFFSLVITSRSIIPGRFLILQSIDKNIFIEGEDFLCKPDHLLFKKNPSSLFPHKEVYAVLHQKDDPRYWMASWTASEAVESYAEWVPQFYRSVFSEDSFEKALAATAGVPVLTQPEQVTAIRGDNVYLESLYFKAHHPEKFTVGQTVPRGYILNNQIQVSLPNTSKQMWWRDIPEWAAGGLLLNNLVSLPFSGPVLIPDDYRAVRVVSSDIGDVDGERSHISLGLQGSPSDIALYEDEVHARESASEIYLNATEKLPKNGTPRDINPLDLFFKYFFTSRAAILHITSTQVPRLHAALRFFRDNLPVGYVAFVSVAGGSASTATSAQKLYFFDSESGQWQSLLTGTYE